MIASECRERLTGMLAAGADHIPLVEASLLCAVDEYPDNEIPLKSPPGVGVNWIYRGGRADLVPEETRQATTHR